MSGLSMQQALMQLESVVALVAALDGEDQDAAYQAIHEDPLEVSVRSAWRPSGEPLEPAEFCILLTTGGPAVRIFGELNEGEAVSAHMQHQDWFEDWKALSLPDAAAAALLRYAQCFFSS